MKGTKMKTRVSRAIRPHTSASAFGEVEKFDLVPECVEPHPRLTGVAACIRREGEMVIAVSWRRLSSRSTERPDRLVGEECISHKGSAVKILGHRSMASRRQVPSKKRGGQLGGAWPASGSLV